MVFGEKRLFIIEYPGVSLGITEFFLSFMGKDQNGLKMKGAFPGAWTLENGKVKGPLLFDEDSIYEVVMMDHDQHLIWLSQVFNNS